MNRRTGTSDKSLAFCPVAELYIDDTGFSWRGRRHGFVDVSAIRFIATMTRHSMNGIPTGRTFEVSFSIQVTPHMTETITGERRTFRSGITEESFTGLQKANAIISHYSFNFRVEKYEQSFAEKGYFDYCGYQFNRDGDVFKNGKYICSFRDSQFQVFKHPFSIVIEKKIERIGDRLRRMFHSNSIEIPLEWDQDCFFVYAEQVVRDSL